MKVYILLALLITGMTVTVSCRKRTSKSASTSDGTGEYKADGTESVEVKGASESSLKDSSISIPPGALAVDSQIYMVEGESIANDHVSQALGLAAGDLASAGQAIVVEADPPTDALAPMTIAISTGNQASLALLAQTGNLVVLYKQQKVGDDELRLGAIPTADLKLSGDTVTFETTHFGQFQAAFSADPITAAIDVVTEIPIQKRADKIKANFSTSAQTVAEGTGSAEVTVTISAQSHDVVTVPFKLSGTANSDDHGLIEGMFQIPAGETEQSLQIKITADGTTEGNETLILTLQEPHHAILGDKASHTLTITD